MENPLAEHEAAQAALPYPAIRKLGINMQLSWEAIFDNLHARRYGAFVRLNHDVITPVPEQDLADFPVFKEQWDLLQKVGKERKFLGISVSDDDDEYSTEGHYDFDREVEYVPYVPVEPKPKVENVYDETQEEFEARVDASYAHYNETKEWLPGAEPVVPRRGNQVDTLLDPWFNMVSEEVAEYRKNYKW